MAITVSGPEGLGGAAPALRAVILRTLSLESLEPGEIAVLLGDDARLRELNRRFRGLDRATDVLSFRYDAPGPGARAGRGRARRASVHGELAISLDRSIAQARRFRVTEGEELARLVIHGALHLAGLDHQRPSERRHMRAFEDRALAHAATAARRLDRALAAWRAA